MSIYTEKYTNKCGEVANFMLLKQQGNEYSSSSLYESNAWNLIVKRRI
jgi:hypothetical protein